MNKKIKPENINLIKTISMIFVCYIHYGYFLCFTDKISFINITAIMVRYIASAAVPLFFMVNGALVIGRDSNDVECLLRFKKLIIVTIIINVITVLIYNIIYSKDLSLLSIYKGVTDIFAGNQNQHLWFLYTLSLIYLLLPLINSLFMEHRQKYGLLVFAIIIIATFGNTLLNRVNNLYVVNRGLDDSRIEDYHNYFVNWNIFIGASEGGIRANQLGFSLVYFVLGAILVDMMNFIKKYIPILGMLFLLCFVSYSCYIYYVGGYLRDNRYIMGYYGYEDVCIIVTASFIFLLLYTININNGFARKFLDITGRNTLLTYAAHRGVGELLLFVSEEEYGVSVRDNFFYGIISGIVVWMISLFFAVIYKTLKRYFMMR